MKLYKPSESNMLFDGGSLVLYMCGVVVYITNIIKGLRVISSGDYSSEMVLGEAELNVGKPIAQVMGFKEQDEARNYEAELLGREDTMKVLAASNTILALVLVGVLVLQSGQWYAEKKQREEEAKMEKEDKEKEKEKGRGIKREVSGSKKKQ
jgi:hypothetical protein